MNYHPGLVSISFRTLTPEEVIALVAQAGLKSIEWGGDVHVPAGAIARARTVRELMRAHRLTTAAYGSYYRVGEEGQEFEPVLESALALGAPVIRVWTGLKGSANASEADREKVAADLRQIAAAAEPHEIVIATEFHANTLTDTADSLLALFRAVDHPNLRTYWQPSVDRADDLCLQEIAQIGPWLTHLHAYQWNPGVERRPLAEGAERWAAFLNAARQFPGDRHVLLEFVQDDSPEAFLRDAATLREWLAIQG